MLHLQSTLPSMDFAQQHVFVRADLNVPLADSTILDDYRLESILPTIHAIQQKQGMIILATHIGRPHGTDPRLSTKLLLPWFETRGLSIAHAASLAEAHTLSTHTHDIILLENLRFWPEEQACDSHFAQELARLAPYYVHDAFGAAHEEAASLTILPTLFPPSHRTIGLLVEKELQALNRLLEKKAKPFVLIIGGNKVAEKLPVIKALIPKVDTILLCPAMVFTVLKAQGKQMGSSLIEEQTLSLSREIVQQAQKHAVQVLFPRDYYITKETFEGEMLPNPVSADAFPHDGYGITIGPATAHEWEPIIHKAHTLFYNGLMGDLQRKETLYGIDALLKAMSNSPAFTVIGGGDSVASARRLGYADQISYLSTGGGATLAYISNRPLKSLELFQSHKAKK